MVRMLFRISRLKYPVAFALLIFRWDLIQVRLPWVRERQISSPGYQMPLRLL
jgi:hypothetical protein